MKQNIGLMILKVLPLLAVVVLHQSEASFSPHTKGCRRHISSLTTWERGVLKKVRDQFHLLHKQMMRNYRREANVDFPARVPFQCRRESYSDEGEKMFERMNQQFGLFIDILDLIRAQEGDSDTLIEQVTRLRKELDRLIADTPTKPVKSLTLDSGAIQWPECLYQLSDYGHRFARMLGRERQCSMRSLGSLGSVCCSRLTSCGCTVLHD